jgi:hypothetical protein
MSDIFDWAKIKKNHPSVGYGEVMLQDIRNQQIQAYIDLGRMQRVGQEEATLWRYAADPKPEIATPKRYPERNLLLLEESGL